MQATAPSAVLGCRQAAAAGTVAAACCAAGADARWMWWTLASMRAGAHAAYARRPAHTSCSYSAGDRLPQPSWHWLSTWLTAMRSSAGCVHSAQQGQGGRGRMTSQGGLGRWRTAPAGAVRQAGLACCMVHASQHACHGQLQQGWAQPCQCSPQAAFAALHNLAGPQALQGNALCSACRPGAPKPQHRPKPPT